MTSPRPTLDEQYALATSSSDLAPVVHRRVDLDYMIAAGIVKEGVGTKLFRLAGEWDLAAGDYRLARREVHRLEAEAAKLRRQAGRIPDVNAINLIVDAGRRVAEARSTAITARVMAMVHLKTLDEARHEVGRFSLWLATKQKFMEPDGVVVKHAGEALSLWLDAVCSSCHGRGFNGGFNGPKVMCTVCGNTGRAHWTLSKTLPHERFVRSLLAHMDLKVHNVERAMRRLLRQ